MSRGSSRPQSRSATVSLILDSLPPVQRLAVAYAPKDTRAAWLGLLALDGRLAQVVREAREPMLAQIRLAWWRERLAETPEQRPHGEPLLALLGDRAAAFAPLVDGWEALLGEPPLPPSGIADFAGGRAAALGGLAESFGRSRGDSERAGRRWALADLARRLSHAREREEAIALIEAGGARVTRLPREMRPLVVLQGLALRGLKHGRNDSAASGDGPGALLAAVRLGIFGR